MSLASQSDILANALCAVSALICPVDLLEQMDRKTVANAFYQRVTHSLMTNFRVPTLAHVLALTMSFIYCRDSGLGPEALNFRFLAASSALEMYQVDIAIPMKSSEDHIRRCTAINIFWFLCSIDWFSSILLSTEPAIPHQMVKIPLPMAEQDFDLAHYKRNEVLEIGISSAVDFMPIPKRKTNCCSYFLLMKLSSLISLYFRARRKSIDQTGMDYREACLEASLFEWREGFQPVPDFAFERAKWRPFALEIAYHAGVITLYMAKVISQPVGMVLQPNFEKCIKSAQRITDVISLFVAHQIFKSTTVMRFISHGVFVSSAIHEILIREHQDLQIVEQARMHFNTNIVAASGLAELSLSSKIEYERLLKRLESLQEHHPETDALIQFYYDLIG
ncbi:hypothetical protein EDD86DRAFT_209340 [Gorgonomyces haynaldii]|nr:hypothetical protein EDD86DRAFT_209340 [Gorgonomyces haynaldii]